MRPFYENLPFLCIFLAMLAGITTSILHSGKWAIRISTTALTVIGAASAWLLYETASQNTYFVYAMGKFPSPWGNELRAGPLEAGLALVFCIVMACSLLGGLKDIFEDILPGKQNLYFVMMDMLLASLLSMLYTNDIFTGYVFIEINTIAACAIVMAKDNNQTLVATMRYLVMSLLGSGLFLISLALLYSITGHLLMPQLGESIHKLFVGGMYNEPLTVLVGLMVLGLAIKSALFPFHSWLPDAHGSSTTASSAILSGLVLKGYIVLLIKIFYRVFSISEVRSLKITNVLFVLGALAMIMGSVKALQEGHSKGMGAYSSVAQIGYIYMGLGLGIEAGVVAAVFQIIAHAFTKPLLFVSVGALSSTAGHEKKWYYLRGAGRRCKLAGIGFTVGGLSMVGIPLLAGFVTKLYLAQGATLAAWPTVAALAVLAVSSVLNAMYYIPAIVQIWSADSTCQEIGVKPQVVRANPALVVSIVVLGAGVILLGVCYRPVVSVISAGLALL